MNTRRSSRCGGGGRKVHFPNDDAVRFPAVLDHFEELGPQRIRFNRFRSADKQIADRRSVRPERARNPGMPVRGFESLDRLTGEQECFQPAFLDQGQRSRGNALVIEIDIDPAAQSPSKLSV